MDQFVPQSELSSNSALTLNSQGQDTYSSNPGPDLLLLAMSEANLSYLPKRVGTAGSVHTRPAPRDLYAAQMSPSSQLVQFACHC